MGIWVSVKTTIELPEALFRRAKSMAAQEGVTLKKLLTEALESRLYGRAGARNGKGAPRGVRGRRWVTASATGTQDNRACHRVRIRENRARGSLVILDTNALSALLDKDTALLEAIRQSRELALPVLVLGA